VGSGVATWYDLAVVKKLVAAVAVLALVAAFISRQSALPEQRELTAEETRIVEIARAAVIANGGSVHGATFEPKPEPQGQWTVFMELQPRAYGSHCIVVIDATGKVIDYVPGA
jgi:hypothetical protein